jgi:hypothetical protein
MGGWYQYLILAHRPFRATPKTTVIISLGLKRGAGRTRAENLTIPAMKAKSPEAIKAVRMM